MVPTENSASSRRRPASPSRRAVSGVFPQSPQGVRRGIDVLVGHDQTGLALHHELAVAAVVAAHDGQAAGHVLHDRVRDALLEPARVREERPGVGLQQMRDDLHDRRRHDEDTRGDEVGVVTQQALALGALAESDEAPGAGLGGIETARRAAEGVPVLLRRHPRRHDHGERVGGLAHHRVRRRVVPASAAVTQGEARRVEAVVDHAALRRGDAGVLQAGAAVRHHPPRPQPCQLPGLVPRAGSPAAADGAVDERDAECAAQRAGRHRAEPSPRQDDVGPLASGSCARARPSSERPNGSAGGASPPRRRRDAGPLRTAPHGSPRPAAPSARAGPPRARPAAAARRPVPGSRRR